MRAREFITEYIDDLHTWVTWAKNAIVKKIDSGEISNDPESIKNAAKQLAMGMKDKIGGVDPEMISREVENQIYNARISQKA